MVTEHFAVAPVRVAMTLACSLISFESTKVELMSLTPAETLHVMGTVDGRTDATVMVKLVTILPVATDTTAGFPIGCMYIGRNELLPGFRYPRISGLEPGLALWLHAVPPSIVAKAKTKTTFDSFIKSFDNFIKSFRNQSDATKPNISSSVWQA